MIQISEEKLQQIINAATMNAIQEHLNQADSSVRPEETSEVDDSDILLVEEVAEQGQTESEDQIFKDSGKKWESSPLPSGLRELKCLMASDKLRDLMKRQMIVLDINQKEFAEGSGVAPTTISGIMCGRSETTAKKLYHLSEYLDCGEQCIDFLKREFKKRKGISWSAYQKNMKRKKSVQQSFPESSNVNVDSKEDAVQEEGEAVRAYRKLVEDSANKQASSDSLGSRTDLKKIEPKRNAIFNLKNVHMKPSPEVLDLLKRAYHQEHKHNKKLINEFPDHLLDKTVNQNRMITKSLNQEALSRFFLGQTWMTLAEFRLLCRYLGREDFLGEFKKDIHQINF